MVLLLGELQVQQGTSLRLLGLSNEGHVGLSWSASTFADIAVHTRANDVIPSRAAALASRDHVVQAQLARRKLLPAILALVVIAGEDVASVKLDGLFRQLVVTEQSDHPRGLNLGRRRTHPIVLLLAEVRCPEGAQFCPCLKVIGVELTILKVNNLGQLLAQQAERSADGDDVHGYERLVQYQHARVQGRVSAGIHIGCGLSQRSSTACGYHYSPCGHRCRRAENITGSWPFAS